ncbi:MAG: hypothetical protein DK302_000520 [Chloroflexi bacterium]|nr:MAG: hypothetical protein DK302_000520 [Chloroflexota bacterium]
MYPIEYTWTNKEMNVTSPIIATDILSTNIPHRISAGPTISQAIEMEPPSKLRTSKRTSQNKINPANIAVIDTIGANMASLFLSEKKNPTSRIEKTMIKNAAALSKGITQAACNPIVLFESINVF